MINEKRQAWLASREEAGRMIDVETCKITWWWAKIADPYGTDPDSDDCIGRVTFVKSAESNGWVSVYDLPEDKVRALYERIERGEEQDEEFPWV
ncbi:hypothetical protein ACE10X_21300 [Bradyrhizobium sp. Pha-3]|uniref:hypothetical protein n=1 Tax=Bradyrhizobium sp. Pha-3 TaxID=208375 RepID=UPI0035D41B70